MNKKLTYAAIGAILIGTAASSIAATFQDTMDVAQPIVEQLESEGWIILEVEVEDGEIEIEAEKDGQQRELVVEAASGLVLSDEVEADD